MDLMEISEGTRMEDSDDRERWRVVVAAMVLNVL